MNADNIPCKSNDRRPPTYAERKFNCPKCGKEMILDLAEYAEKLYTCPHCKSSGSTVSMENLSSEGRDQLLELRRKAEAKREQEEAERKRREEQLERAANSGEPLNVVLVSYVGSEGVTSDALNSSNPIPLSHAREAQGIMFSLACRDCGGLVHTSYEGSKEQHPSNVFWTGQCLQCGKKRTLHFKVPLFFK